MLLLFLIKAYKTTDLDDNTFRLLYLYSLTKQKAPQVNLRRFP
ncbi:hypothetical protein [Mycoplasmopsis bovis]|nr:hypothetical protein [Mycoplasmopsis bovis]